MLSFFNDISKLIGLREEELSCVYKVINVGGRAVYVEGYKALVNISKEEVVLKLDKGLLKVTGKKLTIKDLNVSQIVIIGDIFSIGAQ